MTFFQKGNMEKDTMENDKGNMVIVFNGVTADLILQLRYARQIGVSGVTFLFDDDRRAEFEAFARAFWPNSYVQIMSKRQVFNIGF